MWENLLAQIFFFWPEVIPSLPIVMVLLLKRMSAAMFRLMMCQMYSLGNGMACT